MPIPAVLGINPQSIIANIGYIIWLPYNSEFWIAAQFREIDVRGMQRIISRLQKYISTT